MNVMSITEFLEARIAEDEAEAREGLAQGDPKDVYGALGFFEPDRVLAECAAKRRIVDLYKFHRSNRDARRSPLAREAEDEQAAQERRTQEARTRAIEEAVLSLAAVYKDHPDYQQEWE